jgi:hypothetical protein
MVHESRAVFLGKEERETFHTEKRGSFGESTRRIGESVVRSPRPHHLPAPLKARCMRSGRRAATGGESEA